MPDQGYNVGLNIKKFRRERKITQSELGELLNVSPQAVSKWETGLAAPDIDLLPKVAKILNVTINDLFYSDPSHQNTVDEEHFDATCHENDLFYSDPSYQKTMDEDNFGATCPDCNHPLSDKSKICSVCLVTLENDEVHCGLCHTTFISCPDCSKFVNRHKKHCPDCNN